MALHTSKNSSLESYQKQLSPKYVENRENKNHGHFKQHQGKNFRWYLGAATSILGFIGIAFMGRSSLILLYIDDYERTLEHKNEHTEKVFDHSSQNMKLENGCEATVVLIRHCETEDFESDEVEIKHCNYAGFQRSEYISSLFGTRWPEPSYIYASSSDEKPEEKDYREVETVLALSKRIGVPINSEYGKHDINSLSRDLISKLQHGDLCEKLVLVSLKHDSIPYLAASLGCGEDEGCPDYYPDETHDQAWTITFLYDGGSMLDSYIHSALKPTLSPTWRTTFTPTYNPTPKPTSSPSFSPTFLSTFSATSAPSPKSTMSQISRTDFNSFTHNHTNETESDEFYNSSYPRAHDTEANYVPGLVPGSVPGYVPGVIPGFVPGADTETEDSNNVISRDSDIQNNIITNEPHDVPGAVTGFTPGFVPGNVPGVTPGEVTGFVPGVGNVETEKTSQNNTHVKEESVANSTLKIESNPSPIISIDNATFVVSPQSRRSLKHHHYEKVSLPTKWKVFGSVQEEGFDLVAFEKKKHEE